MSDSGGVKRDKTDVVKWGLAALAAIIVLAVIGYGLIQQSAYSQSATDRSADYTKNAAAQINQACTGISKLEKPICTKKAATEYRLQARDKQREYDDLAAQQTSALWTSIMGIAALIGMGLSAVGVALVYTTFRETRRSADAAHKTYDAFIAFEDAVLKVTNKGGKTEHADGKAVYRMFYTISNIGRSPAYIHYLKCGDSGRHIFESALAVGAEQRGEVPMIFPIDGSPATSGFIEYTTSVRYRSQFKFNIVLVPKGGGLAPRIIAGETVHLKNHEQPD
jgi:hypothetical protein